MNNLKKSNSHTPFLRNLLEDTLYQNKVGGGQKKVKAGNQHIKETMGILKQLMKGDPDRPGEQPEEIGIDQKDL